MELEKSKNINIDIKEGEMVSIVGKMELGNPLYLR